MRFYLTIYINKKGEMTSREALATSEAEANSITANQPDCAKALHSTTLY